MGGAVVSQLWGPLPPWMGGVKTPHPSRFPEGDLKDTQGGLLNLPREICWIFLSSTCLLL